MVVGVLALQGGFEAHQSALEQLGVSSAQVRTPEELGLVDALIIPGGESTTMLKLVDEEGLRDSIVHYQKPMLGCCAGSILMASEVTRPEQECLRLLDIAVERNAYGRQVHSGIRNVVPGEEFGRRTLRRDVEAVFIRAPIIRRLGEGVTALLEYEGNPILVESGSRLAATFHPELTADRRVQSLLLDKIRSNAQ